ncbi:SAM-dependent methyltransferase [Streptomyces albus]|uniref:SAM-dependent methyltransferase n=1 Tax=Streptomyces albus TaxID=1888 RepID=UPI000B27A8D9|nr:class I SAM-dependent methyltransferase [Streptomyces albus]
MGSIAGAAHVLNRFSADPFVQLASEQWNEGAIACSVIRPAALPCSGYAADAALATVTDTHDRPRHARRHFEKEPGMNSYGPEADSGAVDAAFFRTWADSRINLSTGLWPDTPSPGTAGPNLTDPAGLEAAQERKLRKLCELAGVRPGMHVLDVGCGFGGMLDFLVRDAGAASAYGIDVEDEALREVSARATPGVDVECADYTTFRAPRRFDAVISVSALEYASASWSPSREEEVTALRGFFERAHEWSGAGARMAVEVAVTGPAGLTPAFVQAGREMLETVDGKPGTPPTLPNVLTAAQGIWEPLTVHTHREDATQTIACWYARLRAARETIVARWGQNAFERSAHYLQAERDAFSEGALTVALLSFRRCARPGTGTPE